MKDHYSTLGISASATQAEIKAAYRRLALQYHPDRNTAPGATERFLAIQEAWDVLSDPSSKSAYDYNRNYYYNRAQQNTSAASERYTDYRSSAYTPPHSDPYARQEDLYGYRPSARSKPGNSINPHVIRLFFMLPFALYMFFGRGNADDVYAPAEVSQYIPPNSVPSDLVTDSIGTSTPAAIDTMKLTY